MKQERRFSLADVVKYIGKSWIGLLIFAVIGTVVGCVFSYNVSRNQIQAQAQELVQIQNPTNLSEDEKLRAVSYGNYLAYYEKQADYTNHSLFMQLDANNVYKIEMNYAVVSEDKTSIAAFCNMLLGNDELYQNIAQQLEIETTAGYVKELVKLDTINESSDNNITNKNMRITIRGLNQEMAECIKSNLSQYIDEQAAALSKQGYVYTFSNTGETAGYCYDTVVSDTQRMTLINMNTTLGTVNSLKTTLTDTQIAYAQYLRDTVPAEEQEASDKEVKSQEVPVLAEPTVDKQLAALFAILFAALWCVGVMVWYIFIPQIRSDEEYETDYHLYVLGKVRKRKANAEKVAEIAIKLSGIAEKENMQEIYLAGLETPQFHELAEQLVEAANKTKKVSLKEGSNGLESADTIECMLKSGKTVLMAQRGKIKEKDVTQFMQNCEHLGIEIIGVVVYG